MKLVDILARELKEWPESFGESVGQRSDGSLHGYTDNDFVKWIGEPPGFTRCANYMVDRVTRAEWQAAVDALGIPKFPSDAIEWNGEGMPPVGIDAQLKKECKFTEGYRLESFPAGTTVYVGGHANFGGCDLAVVIIKGRHFCGTLIPQFLEPIRTPEQIAADEREKAIKDMVRIIQQADWNSDADMVGALYDTGYRKQEQK